MDYEQALQDLKNGQIDHFEVSPADFTEFQRAWAAFPFQNTVRGIAHRAGQITYVRAN
ncbi:hypothetical protein PT274_00030 [Leuconostocaceae bacterium ESL0958]|nr:hypothetical protein [Leuconostocaceae bacterium ESL0958]